MQSADFYFQIALPNYEVIMVTASKKRGFLTTIKRVAEFYEQLFSNSAPGRYATQRQIEPF
jgi:hypothetical protein